MDTTFGGSMKHWNHWGGRRVILFEVLHPDLDKPFFSFNEEEIYYRRPGDFINTM